MSEEIDLAELEAEARREDIIWPIPQRFGPEEILALVVEVKRLRAALVSVMNVGDRPAVAVAREALGSLDPWFNDE